MSATKKNEDRHIGRRESVWFPLDEHRTMLKAMRTIQERNKSVFIRSAVKNFIAVIDESEKKEEK